MLEEQNRTRKSLQKNLYFSVLQHTHNIFFIIGHFYSPGSIQWKNEILEKVPVKLKNSPFCSFQIKNPLYGFGWMTTVPADNTTEKPGSTLKPGVVCEISVKW